MNNRLYISIATALIGLSAVAISHNAKACGYDPSQPAVGLTWSLPGMNPAPQAAASNPDWILKPLITGMYAFTFTAEGNAGGPPDGTVVDQGYVTWHADGTELMNSGRKSASGNFCMGVWTKTGQRSYALNHFALAWDPTGQTFIGPANIRENINLANDNSGYTGTFTLVQYAPDGTTVLATVLGNIAATRITMDTT